MFMNPFYHLSPAKRTDRHETVILVHGLIRRGMSMYLLGRYLSKHGYNVFIYDYFTTLGGIADHGRRFRAYIASRLRDSNGVPVHIIGHSLGAIVIRQALDDNGEGHSSIPLQRDQIGRTVMLAPPSKGSDLAKRIVDSYPILGRLVKPLSELSSEETAFVHQVADSGDVETGVIAASRDTRVSIARTHLDSEKDHLIVPCIHTFIMNQRSVKEAILHFLSYGVFRASS